MWSSKHKKSSSVRRIFTDQVSKPNSVPFGILRLLGKTEPRIPKIAEEPRWGG